MQSHMEDWSLLLVPIQDELKTQFAKELENERSAQAQQVFNEAHSGLVNDTLSPSDGTT